MAAISTSFVTQHLCDVMWKLHKQQQDTADHNDDDGDDDDDDDGTLPTALTMQGSTCDSNHSESSKQRRDHLNNNNGNHHRPKVEESDIVALCDELLYGHKKFTSVTMIGCSLALALAQMMLCAAIADSMIVATSGRSCAYGLTTVSNTLHYKPINEAVLG